MKLYIKYMISNRCKMAVKEVLKSLDLHFIIVDLGEVEIMETLSNDQITQLKTELNRKGLELMDDKKATLIEAIRSTILEKIYQSDEINKVNFSDFLSEKLHNNYPHLAHLFSEMQGVTIEQFIISHKIERIKELIKDGHLNITEIAWKMNYCSVAHLSSQFKKITGLSPSRFKELSSPTVPKPKKI